MKRLLFALCLLVPTALYASGGGGGGYTKKESTPSLQEIKKTVDDKKYPDAIKQLKLFIDKNSNNADAYNYLGFSYRKSGNLSEAFKAYNKALALDPKHLGAHEYLGEAYLMNKEPEKARGELRTLQALCGNCEEYRDLEKAIKGERH